MNDTRSVQKNSVVPEAEDLPTVSAQYGITTLIPSGINMLAAIGFDDQPSFDASEVNDVGRDRELAPKPNSQLTVTKRVP